MKKELKDYVTTIPDFPQKGIMFRRCCRRRIQRIRLRDSDCL